MNMKKLNAFFIGVITGILLLAIVVSIISITPMDVYKGKTTLKYEVVDGVKVDSTVVWKDDFKNK